MALKRVKTGASLTRKIYHLYLVWTQPGIFPEYHEACKFRLEHDWPMLYEAVQDLVNQVETVDPEAKHSKAKRSFRFWSN